MTKETRMMAPDMMLSIDDYCGLATPAQASDWLAHDNFIGQRDLRPWHVDLLAHLMEDGRFRDGSKIEFCRLDQQLILVDGQHTLSAIKKTGISVRLMILVKKVDSLDEARQRYATFGRELGRTPADVYAALGIKESEGFDARTIGTVSMAIKLMLNDLELVSAVVNPVVAKDAEFIGTEIKKWSPTAHKFLGILDLAEPAIRRKLNTAPVMTMALVLLDPANPAAVQAKAQTFLEAIAMDDALRRGDPAKAVISWLLTTEMRSMGSPVERLQYLASGWNKYYRGEQLETLRKTFGPVNFLGTRFARRRSSAPTPEPPAATRSHKRRNGNPEARV